MEAVLYAEINGFAIIILLMIYFSRKQSGAAQPDQKLFGWLTLSVVVILLLDAAVWLVNGRQNALCYPLNRTFNLLYYILQLFPGLLWVMYCDWKVFESRAGLAKRAWLYALPLVLCAVLTLINLQTGWLYTVDEQNLYQRGPLLWIFWCVSFLYLGYGSALALCKASKCFNELKFEFYYLAAFPLPPLIGVILQMLFYGLSLIWVSITISLCFIYIKVQNNQISSDELTGLNNRRRFNQYVTSKRLAGPMENDLCAMMIDLDHFKSINDTFGHKAGDAALVLAADVLKNYCHGKRAFLARTGGDEFVILLPMPSREDADRLTRRLGNELKLESERRGAPCILSMSAGVAMASDEGVSSIDQLLSRADERMYQVKAQKKAGAQGLLRYEDVM